MARQGNKVTYALSTENEINMVLNTQPPIPLSPFLSLYVLNTGNIDYGIKVICWLT